VLIWGGSITLSDPGGSYDPATDTWESIPGCPFGVASMGAFSTWTGSHLLVFESGRGASYDPEQQVWSSLSTNGAPDALYGSAVWTGSLWILWGGQASPDQVFAHSSIGAKYDPETDTWTPLSVVGAPSAREAHNAVWTGSRMIIWGGLAPSGTDDSPGSVPSDAASYDPLTDTWQPLPNPLIVAAPPLFGATAVSTPSAMLLWALHANDMTLPASGGRLDYGTLSWSPLSQVSEPEQRLGQISVWTGVEMLVWGGYDGPTALASGGRYFP
jgi:N-acetylneuraminic acid mutarotase